MVADLEAPQKAPVLVVEDEQVIRETFQLALEIEGYQVFTASNGREGLKLLASIPKPCLILLDLMMPVMNGWEFMEEIKKTPAFAEIPIVVVTAFSEKARGIKKYPVLPKPVDLTALFTTVERCCGKPGAA